MIRTTLMALTIVAGASAAGATTLTHSANDFDGALSAPFGALGAAVGTFYAPKGVDYTLGNVEGVFHDGIPPAICGINASGR